MALNQFQELIDNKIPSIITKGASIALILQERRTYPCNLFLQVYCKGFDLQVGKLKAVGAVSSELLTD